jgi:hypothetical protein
MPYLKCPSCGLALRASMLAPLIQHCPRCLARRRRMVDLVAERDPLRIGRWSASEPEAPRGAIAVAQQEAVP